MQQLYFMDLCVFVVVQDGAPLKILINIDAVNNFKFSSWGGGGKRI